MQTANRAPSSEWIDVSVPIRDGMVTWPDNPPVELTRTSDQRHGDEATVSKISMGAHTGTHVDAPVHFFQGGASIDAAPLEALMGPARVVHVPDRDRISAETLASLDPRPGERLLLSTWNSDHVWGRDDFVEDFVSLSLEAAQLLAERRVRTVGIDYLSVGGYRDDGAAIHRALLEAGIWIIEGLDLRSVDRGPHELLCLPLRLQGADGAPARVLLRPTGGRPTYAGARLG